MSIQLLQPGQRILTIPGHGLTVMSGRATLNAGVNWSRWFDHFWVAKGAASLSVSYTDLVGSQTLSVGSAPGLGADGWSFDNNYLDTGLYPASGGSLMVRYSDGAESYGQGLVGSIGSGYYGLGSYWYGDQIYYGNGSEETAAAPKLLSGVLAFSGLKVFRNGEHSHTMPGSLGTGSRTYYIGAINDGSNSFPFTGDMAAVGISNSSLSDAEVAAAYAAMAAL